MNYGHFEGSVKVEWVRDNGRDRHMKLLEDFTYIDPLGKRWTAPKGYETDGASIPKAFWSVVGGPFEGGYREAAVIHDWYCHSKTEPWKDVHRIFYYAARAANVSESKAKLLYTAVRVGGPKWGDNKSKCYSCHSGEEGKDAGLDEQEARSIADWVTKNNPSLDEIDAYANEKYPSVLEDKQRTRYEGELFQ